MTCYVTAGSILENLSQFILAPIIAHESDSGSNLLKQESFLCQVVFFKESIWMNPHLSNVVCSLKPSSPP